MKPCLVSGCGIYHDPRMNCKVARNQLEAGTMEEKYKVLNKLQVLVEKKIESPVAPQEVVKIEEQSFVCPVCEARRLRARDKMRVWRKKK